MQLILEIMTTAFYEVKESGSYLLFYLLALGMGILVTWNRYRGTEAGNEWISKEEGKEIQIWPFLYSLLALVLVAANPLCVWVMNKVSPIQGQYERSWSLLLLLFLIAYAVVCFYDFLEDPKQKVILAVGMILLTGLAGTSYGILSSGEVQTTDGEREAAQVVTQLLEETSDLREKPLLAAAPLGEYLAVTCPQVRLLYGKDLYTPNLDLGIMDAYPEELLGIYEAMKNPEENIEHLTQMAYLYDCGVLVVDGWEDAPKQAGNFILHEQTEDYIVYRAR